MPQPATASADRCFELIEAAISSYFTQSIQAAAAVSPAYAQLWQDIYDLVQAGGKRLRPRMVYLSYRAFGGKQLTALAQVAAATELLHVAMLIHDDIIDRDLVRYGVPNLTARYLAHYTPHLAGARERLHYAQSAALLAGDVLLSGAHQLVASAPLAGPTRAAVQAILSHSTFELTGGELLDTEAAFINPADVQPLTIARYKTASYSFIAPLLIGATAAGIADAQRSVLRQFAEHLGVAFQLQDDILGVFGTAGVLGKSTTSDLREGKRTYLITSFEARASATDRRTFERYFGTSDLSTAEADQLRELLVSSGARRQVELKITSLQAAATADLAALDLGPAHHAAFMQLIQQALKRSY